MRLEKGLGNGYGSVIKISTVYLGSGCVCQMLVESVTRLSIRAVPIWRSRSVGQSRQSTFKLDGFTGAYDSDDNLERIRAIAILDKRTVSRWRSGAPLEHNETCDETCNER
jgi:hypothetical protein